MNGDDIKFRNDSMPWFPDQMPLWQRVLCLFGYHKWESRQCAPDHRFGMTLAGGASGLHETRCALRDQCGRCGTLR